MTIAQGGSIQDRLGWSGQWQGQIWYRHSPAWPRNLCITPPHCHHPDQKCRWQETCMQDRWCAQQSNNPKHGWCHRVSSSLHTLGPYSRPGDSPALSFNLLQPLQHWESSQHWCRPTLPDTLNPGSIAWFPCISLRIHSLSGHWVSRLCAFCQLLANMRISPKYHAQLRSDYKVSSNLLQLLYTGVWEDTLYIINRTGSTTQTLPWTDCNIMAVRCWGGSRGCWLRKGPGRHFWKQWNR